MTAVENRSSGLPLADARIREVFHPTLIEHLERCGASSVSQMRMQGFKCFDLALTEAEIRSLVDSARRYSLVEPLGHDRNAWGSSLREVEWTPTELGRRVTSVRTLWLPHLFRSFWDIANPARELFSAWISIAALVASVAFVELSEPSPRLKALLVGVTSALVVYFVLVRAIWSEYRLRSAALAWCRLKRANPSKYRWHTARLRFWPGPITTLLFGAAVLVWALVDWVPAAWLAAFGFLFGLVAFILISQIRPASERAPDC